MKRSYTCTLPANPTLEGFAEITTDIVYTQRPGQDLKLQMLRPWSAQDPEQADKRYPAIVFVQGSAWTTPNPWYQLPQLSQLAQRGYVIASIVHRSIKDGHAAPAFLEDTKTAIRFLRHYAESFAIDPERIGIWGTSSGGNTALLAALTADQDALRTDEYPDESDRVKTCIDCFGPTDVHQQFGVIEPAAAEMYGRLLLNNHDGPFEIKDLEFMSPMHLVEAKQAYPPFLLIHGTADTLVNYEQSVSFHEKLQALGYTSDLVTIPDAPHEGSFWSQALLELIFDYIDDTL